MSNDQTNWKKLSRGDLYVLFSQRISLFSPKEDMNQKFANQVITVLLTMNNMNGFYFGGFIFCILVDFIIFVLYFIRRGYEKKKSRQIKKKNFSFSSSKECKIKKTEELDYDELKNDATLVDLFVKESNNVKICMKFDFENLYFERKGKTILNNITGSIRPARLTAIMGPSGAGKTTFMDVLMGKLNRTKGNLYLNSLETEIYHYRKLIGFVPQEDIMLRELTVYENILHSARVRLPSSWKNNEIEKQVKKVIQSLELEQITHQKIGCDESSSGISGGQRKRVNIAMELAAIPFSLFLDEPTSGLDSTSALNICQILKKLTGYGQTILCVIHQFPLHINPADVLIDALSKGAANNEMLVEKWNEFYTVESKKEKELSSEDNERVKIENELFYSCVGKILSKRGAHWIQQFLWCVKRCILQQYRSISSLIFEVIVALSAGTLIVLKTGISATSANGELYKGIYVDPYTVISPAPAQTALPLYGLLTGFAVALSSSPAGVKVFSEEKPLFWRETASGHNSLAYYLGKTIGCSPRFILSSLHYSAFYQYFAAPTFPNFGMGYMIVLMTFFGVYGMCAFVSSLVNKKNANLSEASKWGLLFMWEISFNKWGTEALFSSSVTPMSSVYKVDDIADFFGYSLNQEYTDLGMMLLIGVVFRVFSYFGLIFINRNKLR
ncbi:hypothetical protein HK099_004129 [Clydaea vesicula]|uniref:ABC transporter domain-containing protein n=1 Tax=Clydaea vesicula TaxID=447962 RepID=A0AAD5U118_9FUNG|nr:hypothetical protein HK099_004129 [Clydaea vesicula]